MLQILADKGRAGVAVKIALGDPDGPNIAERGAKKASATPWPPRSATPSRFTARLCAVENIEIRLHRTVLYNSIYRADDLRILVQGWLCDTAIDAVLYTSFHECCMS